MEGQGEPVIICVPHSVPDACIITQEAHLY